MATAKRKHLLAAAIILLLRRSRKRFSKWENRRIWSKTWILRRETHGVKLSQGMIRFASFSSVQIPESLLSAILKSHVIKWLNKIG